MARWVKVQDVPEVIPVTFVINSTKYPELAHWYWNLPPRTGSAKIRDAIMAALRAGLIDENGEVVDLASNSTQSLHTKSPPHTEPSPVRKTAEKPRPVAQKSVQPVVQEGKEMHPPTSSGQPSQGNVETNADPAVIAALRGLRDQFS